MWWAVGGLGAGGGETALLTCALGESSKAAGKGRSGHRARSKRGSRARASKDTSKLLLLYDENILERDPLREQKDLAFAQAYLTRVGKCGFLFPPFPLKEGASPSREECVKWSLPSRLPDSLVCLCLCPPGITEVCVREPQGDGRQCQAG